ncbi:MAG: diguanylate cyclase [Roseburia sp.]|nr:diguanylate cyclase [Roseburia sp.]
MEKKTKKDQSDKKELKKSIKNSLLNMTMIPIIVFGIIIIVYCSNQLTRSIYNEVESELKNLAQTAVYTYDRDNPGEYRMDKATSTVYKGDKPVEGSHEIFEAFKEISGTDITIFYNDMRIVTTIRNEEKEPIVGTKANPTVRRDVIDGKAEHFYTSTKINDQNYFSYYCPLYDSQHKCIGMVFAGRPSQYVSRIVLKGVIPVVIIICFAVLAIVLIMWQYSKRLTGAMQHLQNFLTKVETGDFTTELESVVSERKDELGRIGKSAVEMQSTLRKLIEQDSLTGLYNRHYGEIWLKRAKKKMADEGTRFYVAIADIDFFKKFNDNYGHDCGDMVLKMVSNVLMDRMKQRGYASRWGGEEFLLIFEDESMDQAFAVAEKVAKDIKNIKIRYNGETLGVRVTIGITEGASDKKIDEIVKEADNALYHGKENGRDQVVRAERKN